MIGQADFFRDSIAAQLNQIADCRDTSLSTASWNRLIGSFFINRSACDPGNSALAVNCIGLDHSQRRDALKRNTQYAFGEDK